MKAITWLPQSNIWNSLSPEQRFSLLSLAAALGFNLIVWYLTHELEVLYVSLVFTLTRTLAADRVVRFRSENKAMSDLSNFNAELARINRANDPLDLHYIGDSRAGFTWLSRNYHGLISVDNTVYRPKGEHYGFVEDHYQTYFDTIKQAIDNRCGWRDYALSNHVGAIHEFYNSLTEQQRQRYSAYEMSSDLPIFQVTIFRYDDDRVAVSFG